MKKISGKLNIITFAVFIISLAVAIFRGFILLSFIEKANGLYTNQTVEAIFLACMGFIAVSCVAIYFFLRNKDVSQAFSSTSGKVKKGSYLVCALCFVCLLATEAMSFVYGGVLGQIQLVLCVFSAVYFVIAAFKGQHDGQSSCFSEFSGLFLLCGRQSGR